MRIISQDGRIDLPYDQMIVKITNGTLLEACSPYYLCDTWWLVAKSTKAEAIAEMEAIRQSYLHGCKTHKIR